MSEQDRLNWVNVINFLEVGIFPFRRNIIKLV